MPIGLGSGNQGRRLSGSPASGLRLIWTTGRELLHAIRHRYRMLTLFIELARAPRR